MTHNYSIHMVWSDEDQSYIACVPELPGCKADGATPTEALSELEIVVTEWLETAKQEKREIPPAMSTAQYEKAAQKFRESVREQIKREVENAVSNIMRDLPEFAGRKDPADFWKEC